jgi:hypothetical protein
MTTYTWSTGPNTASISVSPSSTSTYTINGTNAGCLSSKVATIVVTPLPIISANNQTICPGGTATITASGATTYTWNTGFVGNPLTVSPAINTNYTVAGTSTGCANSKTVSVTVGTSLSIFISASQQSVCASGTSTLTASGATSYTWNTGSNATSIVVNPTTNTTYSVTGSNGACTGNNTTTISVVSAPALAITPGTPVSICQGNSATLTASGSYTSFVWTSPTVNGSSVAVTPSVNTSYTVSASGNGGCSTSSVVAVTVNQNPSASATSSMASCSSCSDGSVTVNVTGGSGPYSYLWNPGSVITPSLTNVAPACYTVNVSDANGCVTQASTCVSFATGITVNSNNNSLMIYPNPAQEYVNIIYTGKHFNYTLYNNLGQLISEGNNLENLGPINVSQFTKGVYMLVIINNNETVRKKLVID